MLSRYQILDKINEIIVEEHGTSIGEGDLITSCGIDSFGYAILWTSLEAEYEFDSKKLLIDYSTLKGSDIIDIILAKGRSDVLK